MIFLDEVCMMLGDKSDCGFDLDSNAGWTDSREVLFCCGK